MGDSTYLDLNLPLVIKLGRPIKGGILGSTTAIVYSYFKKSCPKKCARDNPEIARGNVGYDQYAVPSTVAVESLLLLFFSISKHMSIVRWPRRVTHAN